MITIAGIDFDYHDYDERGDVLYLHVGEPKEPPAKAFETPEGHTVEYDEHGAVVGVELMGVRSAVDEGGAAAHLAAGTGRGECIAGGSGSVDSMPIDGH